MLPLSRLDAAEARGLSGLLFDLDDTFLRHGRLEESAYSALFRLSESGLLLLGVTGRPASWAEVLAGLWPVSGIVAENGALSFSRVGPRVVRHDTATSVERATRQARLAQLVDITRRALPELVPADDTEGRVSDYTFDIGEYQRAPEDLVKAAIELAAEHGARTTRSSVHLHFTYDQHDKASGAVHFLGKHSLGKHGLEKHNPENHGLAERGFDATLALARFAYVGDSTNDAPCFGAFRTTVGVQNIAGSFSILPRFVTQGRSSDGFVELAERLVELRLASAPLAL